MAKKSILKEEIDSLINGLNKNTITSEDIDCLISKQYNYLNEHLSVTGQLDGKEKLDNIVTLKELLYCKDLIKRFHNGGK